MSYTPVQNRFWSDGWVRQLNALDRYLFLYLLTNGRGNLTGIYELPLDLMAAECGIDDKDLRLSMLTRLEPKVFYKDGWVIMVNYLKHRVSDSPKYLTGISNQFNELPVHVQEIARSLGYPIDTVTIGNRIRIDKIRKDTGANAQIVEEKVSQEEDSKPLRKKKVTPEIQSVFDLFTDNPARFQWRLYENEREAASILHREFGIEELTTRYSIAMEHRGEKMCPIITSPSTFLEKMPNMENFLKNL